MTSRDTYLIIGGQEFRVEDGVIRPVDNMDFQREFLRRFDGIDRRLDSVDKRLDGVEHRLDGVEGRLGKLEARVGAVETEQRVTNGQFGMLEHIIYWGFAFVTLVVAFVSWMRPRDSKPEPKPERVPSRFELEGMIMDVVREMLPDLKH